MQLCQSKILDGKHAEIYPTYLHEHAPQHEISSNQRLSRLNFLYDIVTCDLKCGMWLKYTKNNLLTNRTQLWYYN